VELNTVLVVLGGSLLVMGLLSRLLKRLFLSTVLLAVLLGIGLGPSGLGVIDPTAVGDERRLMEQVARVTLAIALMGTGLQITRADLRENVRSWVSLLTGGMVGMWVLSGLGAWLLLDLPFWSGFLLGAILTPTDPVVATALVTGPLAEGNLPRWLRRTLQIESGANDGLALPFVLLGAYMATTRPGTTLGDWAVEAAKQVGLALLVGGAVGFLAARLVRMSLRDSEVEQANLLGVGIGVALLALGLVHVLGGSGILAVFVTALVFSALLEDDVREAVDQVEESISKYFVLPAFILFGAILPFAGWEQLGLSGIMFAAWILLLRRLPAVVPILTATRTPASATAFLGWFGPVGVAAIYYATFVERFAVPGGERLFAAATLAICASIVVHSVTATPGARLYARRSPFATLAIPCSPNRRRRRRPVVRVPRPHAAASPGERQDKDVLSDLDGMAPDDREFDQKVGQLL